MQKTENRPLSFEEAAMRVIQPINDNWKFFRDEGGVMTVPPDGAETVCLPHTWNAVDGHDGHDIDIPRGDWAKGDLSGKTDDGYVRGSFWYCREIEAVEQPLPGGRLYVEVPAAGAQAEIFVNGKKIISHEGGYSAFRADITDALKPEGNNLLSIRVSNEYTSGVYPQHADFTFYGGLYRGVNLISVPEAHFDLDYFGSCGLMVTPRLCDGGTAEMTLRTFVRGADENYTVSYEVLDKDGKEKVYAVRPSDRTEITVVIPDPKLWSPGDPVLYTVRARLVRRNEVCDEVSVRAGIRGFACSPDEGFILNGRALPLRGVSRHQDRLYQGNALAREDHFDDARIIKELGANSIRLAHYQHSQDFYDACDELGFVVWAEIPFITIMNKDPAAHENCRQQMKELIIQNYNHPCICFWGLSNEVLLGGKLSEKLVENHRDLESLVKELDPTRLTTIAHVTNTPGDCGLHGITDVEAYNHYFGWYVGKKEDNGPWLDSYHKAYPERCVGLSEYGCEGIVTYHSEDPKVRDYSEEYQALYHEELVRVLDERPWVWCGYVWNMFDFGAAARNEGGVAGRNNKGLMTLDRRIRKDAYYIYKAYWNPEPMVHICGKRYAMRAGESTEIRVYSNQPEVSLYLNGRLLETKSGVKVFIFRAALEEGINLVAARAGAAEDQAYIEKVSREPEIYTVRHP